MPFYTSIILLALIIQRSVHIIPLPLLFALKCRLRQLNRGLVKLHQAMCFKIFTRDSETSYLKSVARPSTNQILQFQIKGKTFDFKVLN